MNWNACFTGVAIYYTEQIYGAPVAFSKHLRKFASLHQINIFLTVRSAPVPCVLSRERLLLRPLGIRGVFHCVAR